MSPNQCKIAQHDADNLEAASIIAADPEKYPDGSLMAQWSDLVLSNAAAVKDADVGPLFRQKVA